MAYEEQRAERDFRQNPPSSAPGQNDDALDWDSMSIGSSSAESVSNSYNSNINDTLNGAGAGFGSSGVYQQQNPMGMNPMGNQQSQVPIEDKVFALAGTGAKGVLSYAKALVESFRNNTANDWHILGERVCLLSVITLCLGMLSLIINVFTKKGNDPFEMLIGSILSLMFGLTLLMLFAKDKSPEQTTDVIKDSGLGEDFGSTGDDDWGDLLSDDTDDGFMEDPDGFMQEDNSNDEWGDLLEDDFSVDDSGSVNDSNFNTEDAVSELAVITPGTQTRSYLLEAYLKVLPSVCPGYSIMDPIYEDSDEFFRFEELLRNAAFQVGMKEENLPELMSVSENPFVYRLNCSRPQGMKEQAIADEIASTFSRDENNMLVRFGVYANVETSTGVCSINLFKGYTEDASGKQVGGVIISLGDIYRQIKSFILNTDVEIPYVWGVNEQGKTLYCDMKDNNSMIISGEPRGGKSWKGQSTVAQLAMFHSPKEIEFYFLDHKDKASDYRHLSEVLPHAKYFCGDRDKINDSLEKIIDKALNTNGEIMSQANFINIKDYNKAHPDNPLPYMYVVIDELQSLMDYFDESGQKEECNRFRSYLSTFASKLPYLGLRFILFPHRIVNQVISKNTYSLVSCRAVVNQLDADEVQNAVGASKTSFRYKLAQKGDMGIRLKEINGGEACFCHAEILSKDNKSNEKLFDYIGAVWRKLEPDCECIKINGKIGGTLSYRKVSSEDKSDQPIKNKSVSSARDVTEGKESYKYSKELMSGGSSLEGIADESIFTDEEDDESFWDELMKDN